MGIRTTQGVSTNTRSACALVWTRYNIFERTVRQNRRSTNDRNIPRTCVLYVRVFLFLIFHFQNLTIVLTVSEYRRLLQIAVAAYTLHALISTRRKKLEDERMIFRK